MRWPIPVVVGSSTLRTVLWPAFFRRPPQLSALPGSKTTWAGRSKIIRNYPLKIRIGAAAGEPVEQDRDLFGSTVQLAARLCSQALKSWYQMRLPCLGEGLLFEDPGEIPLRVSLGQSAPMPSYRQSSCCQQQSKDVMQSPLKSELLKVRTRPKQAIDWNHHFVTFSRQCLSLFSKCWVADFVFR